MTTLRQRVNLGQIDRGTLLLETCDEFAAPPKFCGQIKMPQTRFLQSAGIVLSFISDAGHLQVMNRIQKG